MTPEERFSGKKPDLSELKVFCAKVILNGMPSRILESLWASLISPKDIECTYRKRNPWQLFVSFSKREERTLGGTAGKCASVKPKNNGADIGQRRDLGRSRSREVDETSAEEVPEAVDENYIDEDNGLLFIDACESLSSPSAESVRALHIQ